MRHLFFIAALAVFPASLLSGPAHADWRAGIVFDGGGIYAGDGGFAIGVGPRYSRWPRNRHRGYRHRRDTSPNPVFNRRSLRDPDDRHHRRDRYRRDRYYRGYDRYYGWNGVRGWAAPIAPVIVETPPEASAIPAPPPQPKAGAETTVVVKPDAPLSLPGDSIRYSARGKGRARLWASGQQLPANVPYVKLNPGPYSLPDPPAGRIYARLGRQIVILDPTTRVIDDVLTPAAQSQ